MIDLKPMREAAGLSKGELSRRSGVSRRTIIRIEQDAGYEPGINSVRKIAEALGTTIDELIHGDNGTSTHVDAPEVAQNDHRRPTAANGVGRP